MGHYEIGILNNDSTITKIKCETACVMVTNNILTKYYTDEEKVRELISKGDLLYLEKEINPSENLIDVCLYCHRDDNTSWEKVKPVTISNIEEWKNAAKENQSKILYLFIDGSWHFYSLEKEEEVILNEKPKVKEEIIENVEKEVGVIEKAEAKEEIIEKAIAKCEHLINQYNNGLLITVEDITCLINTLKGNPNKNSCHKTRVCHECKNKNFKSGYVVFDEEHYCSDECLHKNYSDGEYKELYRAGVAYHTCWEIS